MIQIRPFQGVRPAKEYVDQIAALPYDVYTSSEARKVVEKNPLSFLKVDRAETQFPEGTDMYSKQVYERARDTLKEMEQEGLFIRDEKRCFYLYELIMEGRSQVGIVCCVSIDDYLDGKIKKHENTREEKELDRICHVDVCSAHTGPIFLAYRSREEMREKIAEAKRQSPIYDFVSEDGIIHRVWKMEDPVWIKNMVECFQRMNHLYIADGHHRAASAVKAGIKRREQDAGYTGDEEFNYFLAVLFDEAQLQVFDYNRIVHGVTDEMRQRLWQCLAEKFEVEEKGEKQVKPCKKGQIGMYTGGRWYCLTARPQICFSDPVEGLDVSILQKHILEPVFEVRDPKLDPRMQFVGGIRGLKFLKETVDSEKNAVAFSMYPTSMEELFRVADSGSLMPPKSTWFEPKLRSGLFIHEF